MLMLSFLTYLLWISTLGADPRIQIRVALGCLIVGLLPLLLNLSELLTGHWGAKEWVFLAYFLTGTGAVLELYWKLRNEY